MVQLLTLYTLYNRYPMLDRLVKSICILGLLLGASPHLLAQPKQVFTVTDLQAEKRIEVKVNNRLFTQFIYSDTLEKPVLYPIQASDGIAITRGFPWNPQPNDPTDHPHHLGLWMNYEKVNGLDFWNNSFAIPAEKKQLYGWIRTRKILRAEGGDQGIIEYQADWTNQAGQVILQEKTQFVFRQEKQIQWIDRFTELTAATNVSMPDAKDGLLGLRVAHELELPVAEATNYTDAQGNVTRIAAVKDPSVTGQYLTSDGKEGDEAWGTRGNWCMLYGRRAGTPISITIIDHPSNPGYPTYWHARNYGLFAANPLGQKIFSKGAENFNLRLIKGQSVRFQFRIVITAGLPVPVTNRVEAWVKQFEKMGKQ